MLIGIVAAITSILDDMDLIETCIGAQSEWSIIITNPRIDHMVEIIKFIHHYIHRILFLQSSSLLLEVFLL